MKQMSVFSGELQEKLKGYMTRYETKRSAILPALHAIQDEHGYVKDEHVEALHTDFGLDRVQVREVLTFYSMYRTTPQKKFQLLCCDNMVCMMMGSKQLIGRIEERIHEYEKRGKDVPFSVQPVPCLGVCDGAPAMLVNKERHLHVTSQNVDSILDKYAPL
jgi:NADH-quinone oxidoreductase subunit E